ncbi:helix-turn-helix transcriptional regulator [bacterium]|nr:helix-turn-helix transcriptional regulator [bacterium]MBU1615075.1 helix-turn-helix transcriptional regulator [bacterium]
MGLLKEEVAEKAGMDFTSIGAAERGVRSLSLKSLARVAKALELFTPSYTSTAWLFLP